MNLIISAGDDFYRYSLGFGVELYRQYVRRNIEKQRKDRYPCALKAVCKWLLPDIYGWYEAFTIKQGDKF